MKDSVFGNQSLHHDCSGIPEYRQFGITAIPGNQCTRHSMMYCVTIRCLPES